MGDWDESKHPRDKIGEFTSSASGDKGSPVSNKNTLARGGGGSTLLSHSNMTKPGPAVGDVVNFKDGTEQMGKIIGTSKQFGDTVYHVQGKGKTIHKLLKDDMF